MSDQPEPLRRWHTVVASKDPALLDDLLADDVVFRSPAVFAPQEGKALTASYLSAALRVLGPTLRYVSQWHDQASAVLEFEADLDGVHVQGVDILRWNAQGKLVSFTVMVRPMRGLQKLVELMAVQLAASTRPDPPSPTHQETRTRHILTGLQHNQIACLAGAAPIAEYSRRRGCPLLSRQRRPDHPVLCQARGKICLILETGAVPALTAQG